MNNYETVFILTPVLSDAQMKEAVEKFTNLLKAQGAEIVNEENWGLRKLAYPIDKKTTGFYQLVEFKADPSVIATLELNFRRDERVIRFLTFRQDKYAAEYAAKRRNLKSSKETVKENNMAGHMYNGRETELLIPASSLEVLKIAVIFGADAVYIGGEAFGLRAKAKNFSIEDMKEGVKFAHERNVKVYVTANILAHNYDLEGARAYFEELKEVGPDALIISDPGMFTIAKEVLPDIDIHISTQANNTNYMTYNFWWNQGAKRVVSARELSLEEIKEIREHIPDEMEIETFMHGAMCISYSGRCLLSSFLAGRDANRGACTHPCRWKYAVVEENRPGQYMPVYENERGTYIFNSKDLCMIEHIPEMVSSGIDSFKIEGRMKTALYVATVARTYRLAIDDFIEDPEKYKARIPFYKSEISKCTYRQYTTGFFFGKPDENTQIYDSNTYIREYTYLGIVGDTNEQGLYHIEQRNKFSVGETIEVMKPDGQNIEVTVKRIVDENGKDMDSCPHPKQNLYIDLGIQLDKYDILRRQEEETEVNS